MPPIVVTGRDDKVSSRHKKHAESKIAKLSRYFDGIVKIEVILGFDSDDAEAEVLMSVRGGNPLVCHSRAKDLYAAIDTVLDKAEIQLTRHKEKLKAHRGGGSHRTAEGGEVPLEGETTGAESRGVADAEEAR